MKTVTNVTSLGAGIILAGGLIPANSHSQDSWTDSISIKGDIRPRFEAIDEDGEEERQRGRFRIRVGMTADVNDNVRAIVQLASGGDNPVSTNQTFDDGFSRKDIGIDLAYVDWAPKEGMHVFAGKMKNPFFRPGGHALIWDSDLNPEGLALSYEKRAFFGTLANFSVEERSAADDSLLMAAQAGLKFDAAEGNVVTVGVGYFDYSETAGNSPFYDGNPRGNSVENGNLVFDYGQLELFAQLDTKLGDIPVSVFADYVQNSDADTNDTGYAFGATFGKASAPGTWEGSIAYQDLEADAVIATFTDSDFGGGGTDASGFTLKAKYALADNWTFGGTLFLNEVEENIGNEHDYTRLQLDLEFKF